MIKCIIVDDERPARELIELHLSNLNDCTLLGTFDNAIDAFNFLQNNSVDIIFLDVQMPKISGVELIKSLKVCPKIILTTAFREYAVEAFELDVLDYLVKPITAERFMKAMARYTYYVNNMPEVAERSRAFNEAYVFIKTGKDQTKVFLKEILYIEGLKDYVKVHTSTKTYIASERLSYMEEKLPENKFIRIHKSYIISLEKLTSYTVEQVVINAFSLPIGRSYKNSFLKKVKV